ncbi:NUDIX hydrolase [Carbonactinospora thermoautotrophica]|uniref:NUDIX hydrolase n=1 Tax=Carbonactinospora thermoautotrophica TaxID=1469144 RepID=UPI002271900A|nr:NUDIX hydrolase [Carbonactinospora thermoautotrophica]
MRGSHGGLRAAAVRVLSTWPAPDAGQERLRVEYLAHLDRYADGVWRSCTAGHVTASAVVFDAAGERVLLTLHPKVGLWVQMGGHCEEHDASLEEAALREATEESGIRGLRLLPGPVRLDRHAVRCGPLGRCSEHLDVQYAAVAPAGATERISAESLELRWFPADALPDRTDAALRDLVAAARPLVNRVGAPRRTRP